MICCVNEKFKRLKCINGLRVSYIIGIKYTFLLSGCVNFYLHGKRDNKLIKSALIKPSQWWVYFKHTTVHLL